MTKKNTVKVKNNIETRTNIDGKRSYRAIKGFVDDQGKRQQLVGPMQPTLAAARKDLKSIIQQIDDIKNSDDNVTSNSKLVTAYLDWYAFFKVQRGHSQHAVDEWELTANFIINFMPSNVKLKMVVEKTIERAAVKYVNQPMPNNPEKKHAVGSGSMISKHIAHLNRFFTRMERNGVISKNPIPDNPMSEWFGAPKTRKRRDAIQPKPERFFQDDEMDAILDNLLAVDYSKNAQNNTSRIGLLIAQQLGCRPSEIQNLRPSDIVRHPDKCISFMVTKSYDNKHHEENPTTKNGKAHGTLIMTKEASKAIDDYLVAQQARLDRLNIKQRNPRILLSLQNPDLAQEGQPIDQNAMIKQLKNIVAATGLTRDDVQIVPYSLRHSVASFLASESGGDYASAADLLGHSLQTFVTKYVHPRKSGINALARARHAS